MRKEGRFGNARQQASRFRRFHPQGRRSAEGLAARGSGRAMPCTPPRAHWAWGYSNDMQLGRGFTAVARQVPRLAGLVRYTVSWPVQAAAPWFAVLHPA